MYPLRNLRGNCRAAPITQLSLSLVAVAAVVLLCGIAHRLTLLEMRSRLMGVVAATSLVPDKIDLDRLIRDPTQRPLGLRGAALLKSGTEHRVRLERQAGNVPGLDPDAPDQELVIAWGVPRSWVLNDGHIASAVALRAADCMPLALLYLESEAPAPPLFDWLLFGPLAGAVALIGGIMAWYLSRRIFLPVEAMCQQAEAVLAGRPFPGAMASSHETARLASAVSQLAERYQSTRASMAEVSQTRKDPD